MKENINTNRIFKNDICGLKLWQLRHSKVIQLIQNYPIRYIIDFGCNDGILLSKLQRGVQLKIIIGIDIDQQILKKTLHVIIQYLRFQYDQNIIPQAAQYDLQYSRQYDQKLFLFKGSVLQKYEQLQKIDIDLITLVQVIQHIQEKYLDSLNQNIFGFLKPKYVFISTPNKQFNVLFNWQQGNKFRHHDHKFQWTRQQFQNYVQKISQQYGYNYQISGVGQSIIQNSPYGFCSQIVLFTKIQEQSNLIATQDSQNQITNKQIEQIKPYFESIQSQKHLNIPLTKIYQHTNFCWKSQKQRLLEIAFRQVLFQLKYAQIVSWNKFKGQLFIRPIFDKLQIQQKNDQALKKYLSQRYSQQLFIGQNEIRFYTVIQSSSESQFLYGMINQSNEKENSQLAKSFTIYNYNLTPRSQRINSSNSYSRSSINQFYSNSSSNTQSQIDNDWQSSNNSKQSSSQSQNSSNKSSKSRKREKIFKAQKGSKFKRKLNLSKQSNFSQKSKRQKCSLCFKQSTEDKDNYIQLQKDHNCVKNQFQEQISYSNCFQQQQ